MAKTSSAFKRFAVLTDRLLSADKPAVQARISQHREQAASNPRKRGPKKKAKDEGRERS
jgi:hypothetical protein